METVLFKVLAEGGELQISKVQTVASEKYYFNLDESIITDNDQSTMKQVVYTDFETPFLIMQDKYPWYQMHIEYVAPQYKNYVAETLINMLNTNKCDDIIINEFVRKNIQAKLDIQLGYGKRRDENNLQEITVNALVKITEYDYRSFTDEHAATINMKYQLRGKFEVYEESSQYDFENLELISNGSSFKTTGKLEVSNNIVVIKDADDQISYILPADKYIISATPLLAATKEWYIK